MTLTDHTTHDASASCWVEGAKSHGEFPVQNLPLGVFSRPGCPPCIGSAIGDFILDLSAASAGGLLPAELAPALEQPRLNALFALPAQSRTALRHAIFALLTDSQRRRDVEPLLYAASGCTMHLPAQIGDYTDFCVKT